MVAFRYQGRKLDGTAVNGKIDAINSESAVEVLIHKGIIPLNLSLIKETSINSISLIKWLSPAVPLEVVILFSRQLFSLTKAGVPLLRAIRGLLQNCDNKQ